MARKILKITGGTGDDLANVSLKIRELGYDTTNKILYTGASDDGSTLGINNVPISSSILFVGALPDESDIRSDKFYYLTDDTLEYKVGLYYRYDGAWFNIGKSTDPTSIIDDTNIATKTVYSSSKLMEVVKKYAPEFKGNYSSLADLNSDTKSTLSVNANDLVYVTNIEEKNDSNKEIYEKNTGLENHIGESAIFTYYEDEDETSNSCWKYSYRTGNVSTDTNNVLDLGTWT